MYKIPKDKAQLHVLVSKDVVRDLRELVRMKYESLRGGLSWEVEQALRAWLAAQKIGTKFLATKLNPQPKAAAVWEQVKDWLKKTYGYVGFMTGVQIPRDHLVAAIASLRGCHPRTIKTWLENFQRYGLVKQIGPKVYEVV